MYLVIVIVAGIAVVVAALLAVAFRALKAAHTRPPGAAAPPTHGGGGLQRTVLFVVSRSIPRLLRLGVHLGPMMLLTVRGRSTGLPRSNPVDLFERDGRHWLVATHEANASWVRNLRAAREGTLARGRLRYAFTAVELSQEAAGTVLKEVLGPRLAKPAGGFVLRQTLDVPPGASLEVFTSAAASHPVFELAMARDGVRSLTTTTASQRPQRKETA